MEHISTLPLEGTYPSDGDEAALVATARTDPAAFSTLYQRYLPRVYRFLRAQTQSEDDAADLTQQVFLRALDALPRYRERGLPFAAWLFRIARNAATDDFRRQKRLLPWGSLSEATEHSAPGPEAEVLRQERLTRLTTLLDQLDANKRELLALRFAAGLSSREIASVVGKSEAAVKKQLMRTIHGLKEQYREDPS